MKVWMDAEVEVLSLQATENGSKQTTQIDELRSDFTVVGWADAGSGSFSGDSVK